MNRFNVDAAVITHIGSKKSINEDNYSINGLYKSDSDIRTDGIADKKLRHSYTYAVCDGMGGEGRGELAALIAAATLEKFHKTDIRQMIHRYVSTTNDFICELVRKNTSIRAGSTLALLNIQNNTAVSYIIGNSRVYMCRKGRLYLMSKEAIEETPDEILSQHLGVFPNESQISVQTSDEIKVKRGDVFLLCTAGLFDKIDDKELVEFFADEKNTATVIVRKLAAAVQEKNGTKDLTVLVAKIIDVM